MKNTEKSVSQVRIYRINSGSCGGCDLLIDAAVRSNSGLAWAESPIDAQALLLTGPITHAARPALLALWRELDQQVPLIAIGRCAIDGHPFGRGGLAELQSITTQLELHGCPPAPEQIVAAIRQALANDKVTG